MNGSKTSGSDVIGTCLIIPIQLSHSLQLCGSRCRLHNDCFEKGRPTESLVSYFPFKIDCSSAINTYNLWFWSLHAHKAISGSSRH